MIAVPVLRVGISCLNIATGFALFDLHKSKNQLTQNLERMKRIEKALSPYITKATVANSPIWNNKLKAFTSIIPEIESNIKKILFSAKCGTYCYLSSTILTILILASKFFITFDILSFTFEMCLMMCKHSKLSKAQNIIEEYSETLNRHAKNTASIAARFA